MWYVVKGKGDYKMKPKAHVLTDEVGEGQTLQSICGQFFIPINPMTTAAKYPEILCKKCNHAPVVQ